jgi:hypothetical protein
MEKGSSYEHSLSQGWAYGSKAAARPPHSKKRGGTAVIG